MPEKTNRSVHGGWFFLAVVLVGYGMSSLFDWEATAQALDFFMILIRQVFPVLGLVFVLLLVANLLLTPKLIKRYLGKEAGFKGWLGAVGGGILSIGPIYAWYAVLSELKAGGMRTALIATFFCSRAVKLPLLPLMIHYFGLVYTLILCLYLVIFAVINGLVVEKLLPQKTE
ncbi:hypothetical protein N9164_15350 [Draconibacterium sp.]|nr:hypothetical protein [Draconibacterium sp.]